MKWKKCRPKGGIRNQIPVNFLVANHTQNYADMLLTRNRGFQKMYFSDLKVSY